MQNECRQECQSSPGTHNDRTPAIEDSSGQNLLLVCSYVIKMSFFQDVMVGPTTKATALTIRVVAAFVTQEEDAGYLTHTNTSASF